MPVPAGIELLCEIEATFAAQVDVDERHVRAKLLDEPNGLGAVPSDADYIHSFFFKERPCALEEEVAVVDDQTSQRHYLSIV